ncbi:mitochondrial ubiquitin ligase activator of nfkb 1-A isoform X2 [Amia ocellicauda]|uniref:mitochondrial ubiquitin ligase activator of nfkb 1-A isoform X2 n=1 Tax=Amia ocellicauda TaxID=2972642 RepID=UPI003464A4BC
MQCNSRVNLAINTMSDIPISSLTLICVGSSFAFSGLFYHLCKQKRQEIQKLKEIPKFQPNEELLKILKASPHKRLQYVAIEGQIEPDGEPLFSQYVPRCFGVIQRVIVQEHWKVWNSITKTWAHTKKNNKQSTNTVPFSLVSFGSGVSVKVQSPLEASGLYLEQVYRRLRTAKEGFMGFVAQEITQEKPKVLEECEELLRVGATLTGFGELVLERGRVLKLLPPRDGREYILVATDYKSFLQRHEDSVTMWKLLTAVFGIAGTALLAWAIYKAYCRQNVKRDK